MCWIKIMVIAISVREKLSLVLNVFFNKVKKRSQNEQIHFPKIIKKCSLFDLALLIFVDLSERKSLQACWKFATFQP
jgi:hypothetical protein